MTQEQTTRKPSYKEVARASGQAKYDEYYVETGTNVKNGRIVTRGTTEAEIVVAGDECLSPLGWVAREFTNDTFAESDRSTDYTAGEFVGVVRGPITVVGYTAETDIKKGEMLVCAASGGVKKYNADTAIPRVGYAAETVAAAGEILVESIL